VTTPSAGTAQPATLPVNLPIVTAGRVASYSRADHLT